jgi:DNA-binding NarL/FixJ family response regulator
MACALMRIGRFSRHSVRLRQRQWRRSDQATGGSGRPALPIGEVEILRLLAKGLSRQQIATTVYLSEHTVRHHLEHIYNMIGVDARVAATLFAMEYSLID